MTLVPILFASFLQRLDGLLEATVVQEPLPIVRTPRYRFGPLLALPFFADFLFQRH